MAANLALALGAALLLGSLAAGGLFEASSNALFDAYQWLVLPGRVAGAATVVVEIDDESLSRIGQWPWPRDLLARLLDQLDGARVVGVDILLSEPDRLAPATWAAARPELSPEMSAALRTLPDTDAVLAKALARHPTVLAATVSGGTPAAVPLPDTPIAAAADWPLLLRLPAATPPLPQFAAASQAVGLVAAQRDADGVMRRLPLVAGVGEAVLPGFAVELLRVASATEQVELRRGWAGTARLRIGGRVIRTDARGRIWPRYVDPAPYRSVPAWQVLQGRAESGLFRDKIVLMGVTAAGLGERFATPLGRTLPAVGVQAHLAESLLAGETLVRPVAAPLAELLLAVSLVVASALSFGRIRSRRFWLAQSAAATLFISGSFLAFRSGGLLLDWSMPLAAMAITDLGLLLARAADDRRRRREQHIALRAAIAVAEAAQREARLRHSVERATATLAIALDAARMGVWDCDLRSGTSQRSPRHDAIFGCDPAAAWGREAILAQVVAEDRAAVERHFADAARTGLLHIACRIARPDGSRASIVLDGRLTLDANCVPVRMTGVVSDVTEQRRLEEALHQSEKLRSIGMIAGGVAHNFNNVLTVVIANLELAGRDAGLSERVRRRLGAALRAADNGASVTRQLLSYARRQHLRPQRLPTTEALREIARLLALSLREDIVLDVVLPDGLAPLLVDRTELELALLNLTLNARDAMPQGGRIRLAASNQQVCDESLGLAGDFVVLAVADTGTGIPAEVLPHVFEPFLTTKPLGQGTGLGLSQVHGFAHQSGGAVTVESPHEGGTTVRLFLPAAPPPDSNTDLPA